MGGKEYRIEGVFDDKDQITPVKCTTSDELLEYIQPNGKQLMKKPRKNLSSVSTVDQSGTDGSGDRQSEGKRDFTQIMFERWHRSNEDLPAADREDIMQENPLFNNGKKVSPDHQHHPEFTQKSYLRLRSQEEAFAIKNYLKKPSQPKIEKLSITQRISNTLTKKQDAITEYDRSYGIQKIFDLHDKKDYKIETLFIAANIFDRYINAMGPQNFNKSLIINLATISVLMSAKLEQPISPSFSRMIGLLTDEEKQYVTKKSLIDLESQILLKLGFDFNFQGPIQSMERYLRLLGYQSNTTVNDMSYQMCKFQLNDASFLEYRPSEIAAAAVILSINIYEEDLMNTKK